MHIGSPPLPACCGSTSAVGVAGGSGAPAEVVSGDTGLQSLQPSELHARTRTMYLAPGSRDLSVTGQRRSCVSVFVLTYRQLRQYLYFCTSQPAVSGPA